MNDAKNRKFGQHGSGAAAAHLHSRYFRDQVAPISGTRFYRWGVGVDVLRFLTRRCMKIAILLNLSLNWNLNSNSNLNLNLNPNSNFNLNIHLIWVWRIIHCHHESSIVINLHSNLNKAETENNLNQFDYNQSSLTYELSHSSHTDGCQITCLVLLSRCCSVGSLYGRSSHLLCVSSVLVVATHFNTPRVWGRGR